MDISRFTTATIGVVIMLIIVAAVAVPIISSLDSANGENSGASAHYSLGGSHGITVGSAGEVTIDGEAVAAPSAALPVVIADTFTITMAATSGDLTISSISGTAYTASTAISDGSTVSIVNGTMTVTPSGGSGATTYTYTKAYIYDENGTWGAYSGTTIKELPGTTVTAYLGSSTVYAFVDFKGETIVDASMWTISSSTATAVTPSAINATATENEDGTTSYTAPATITYPSSTASATTILAPETYGIENQEAISSMIAIVPLLMIVGAIVAVVGIFLTRKG